MPNINYTPPVQPDTSVGAFLQENPDWQGKERYLYGDPQWIWEQKDHSAINAAYDSWKQRRENQYKADYEAFQNYYEGYLNQSEMLEAAGYNRNWLGSSPGAASHPMDFTPSDGPRRALVQNTPMEMIGAAGQAAGMALDLYGRLADVKVKNAQVDNIKAQADYTKAMTPFRLTKSYFEVLPEYLKWYPGQADWSTLHGGGLASFGTDMNHQISFQVPHPDSQGRKMLNNVLAFQELQKSAASLSNEYRRLSVSEKNYANSYIQPLSFELMSLQKSLYEGQISMQDVEKAIKQKQKEIFERFGEKEAVQNYVKGWVDLSLAVVREGVNAYSSIRGLNLRGQDQSFGQNWTLFNDTGDMSYFPTPLLP